jgi:hypothetical protein
LPVTWWATDGQALGETDSVAPDYTLMSDTRQRL